MDSSHWVWGLANLKNLTTQNFLFFSCTSNCDVFTLHIPLSIFSMPTIRDKVKYTNHDETKAAMLTVMSGSLTSLLYFLRKERKWERHMKARISPVEGEDKHWGSWGLATNHSLEEVSAPLPELCRKRHPGQESFLETQPASGQLHRNHLWKLHLVFSFLLGFDSKGLQSPTNLSCLADMWPSTP